ncbi:hypothetical protein [Flavobacterium sp. KACC 22761]|uniref:hypothetical protein n=1 Tax=Flavobacterium sp. KACC 22761 TaxID=3092665 RepID=UPI002A75757F|nr:hypothetical protein [Flavobacterium sp. KACC 22761]WPO78285.1 hypothetical protein SCB73_18650 [Flavobacterium sp. KACC 22761]
MYFRKQDAIGYLFLNKLPHIKGPSGKARMANVWDVSGLLSQPRKSYQNKTFKQIKTKKHFVLYNLIFNTFFR